MPNVSSPNLWYLSLRVSPHVHIAWPAAFLSSDLAQTSCSGLALVSFWCSELKASLTLPVCFCFGQLQQIDGQIDFSAIPRHWALVVVNGMELSRCFQGSDLFTSVSTRLNPTSGPCFVSIQPLWTIFPARKVCRPETTTYHKSHQPTLLFVLRQRHPRYLATPSQDRST